MGFTYGCNREELLLLPALDSSSSYEGLSAEDSRPVYGCYLRGDGGVSTSSKTTGIDTGIDTKRTTTRRRPYDYLHLPILLLRGCSWCVHLEEDAVSTRRGEDGWGHHRPFPPPPHQDHTQSTRLISICSSRDFGCASVRSPRTVQKPSTARPRMPLHLNVNGDHPSTLIC